MNKLLRHMILVGSGGVLDLSFTIAETKTTCCMVGGMVLLLCNSNFHLCPITRGDFLQNQSEVVESTVHVFWCFGVWVFLGVFEPNTKKSDKNIVELHCLDVTSF